MTRTHTPRYRIVVEMTLPYGNGDFTQVAAVEHDRLGVETLEWIQKTQADLKREEKEAAEEFIRDSEEKLR